MEETAQIIENTGLRIKKYHNIDTIEYPVYSRIISRLNSINELADAIYQHYRTYDKKPLIVCRGNSGVIIGTLIINRLFEIHSWKCIIHIIHKDSSDNRHSSDVLKVVSDMFSNNSPICIIDDFICSGSTVNKIYEKLVDQTNNQKLIIDSIFVTSDVLEENIAFPYNYLYCSE